ncbi:hypothetical protein F5890DRAFT_1415953, partial [Lentinula detonsa]
VLLINFLVSFARRARHFIDGYNKGLDGKMAAWATRKYRGHRILPEGIMKEFSEQTDPV